MNVYASPFGPNRSITRSQVQNLLAAVPYIETNNVRIDTDIAYISYAPVIWRRMRIEGAKIAGVHTHLLLPSQHIKETLMHPFEAGCDWYAKAVGFALLLPAIKTDLMHFDAVHIPSGDFSLFGEGRLYKIPLWIDIGKIPFRKDAKSGEFTVLFVGRKTWEKGWLTFCDASSKLRRMGYRFKFLCTGEGYDYIRGLGFVSEDELFEIYQHSHVLVYPSIAGVFDLVILEAAACGTPVITTPISVHVAQRLPVRYAQDSSEFAREILHTYFMWKYESRRYDAWSENLRLNAKMYDVNKIFPVFEKMLRSTFDSSRA